MLARLRKLGLKTSTLATIAGHFGRRVLGLGRAWEKVSLQPLINLDFFETLWKKYQPDFATFHTNHVAHYQHRFWRATDPTPFLEKPSRKELKQFGGAIRFGYRSADKLLKRVQKMITPDTVIVVASGLGQQPYVVEEFRDGRSVIRIQNVGRLLELLGVDGKCRPYSVMAPQWNIEFESSEVQRQAVNGFRRAYFKTPDQPLFSCHEVGNTICVNVMQKLPRPIDWDADCVFPETGHTIKMRELCAEKDATPKQGYHDPAGLLVMSGPGVKAGVSIGECSTLDIAPTLLTLLGLPIPQYMKGRVLEEALDAGTRTIREDHSTLHRQPAETAV